jgi:hypothetical protein
MSRAPRLLVLVGQRLRKEPIEREESMRHGRCLCNSDLFPVRFLVYATELLKTFLGDLMTGWRHARIILRRFSSHRREIVPRRHAKRAIPQLTDLSLQAGTGRTSNQNEEHF